MHPVPAMVDCHACESGRVSYTTDVGDELEDLCEECGGTGRVPDDDAEPAE